ncbi:hypothetical protein ACQ4PT_013423 [Festuca glaucescens]
MLQIAPRYEHVWRRARDASIAHHARYALLHYNSKNQGAEFDLLKPLMVANVLFRGDRWYHISFWARRRGAPPGTPVQQFFGELHYRCCTCDVDDDAPAETHGCDTPVVETCAIVSKISTFQPLPRTRKKKKPRRSVCILCSPSYEIFHPKNGKFVCGKEEGHEKEFIRFNNLLEKPFTCTQP